jgi:hypothetical protein
MKDMSKNQRIFSQYIRNYVPKLENFRSEIIGKNSNYPNEMLSSVLKYTTATFSFPIKFIMDS